MKFENTKVMNFENAIRGMRNPKNSWDKIDTIHKIMKISDITDEIILYQDNDLAEVIKIGDNDLKLMQTLILAGAEHRKFMRQIFVSVDITAPLYFMAELDTYKVGTTRNSCSFMHKGVSKEFEIEDFEQDDKRIYDILSTRTIKRDNHIVYPYETEEYKEYTTANGRKYEVYKNGKVIALPFSYIDTMGRTRYFERKEVEPSITQSGYWEMNLGGRNGEKWLLHRLVAFLWLDNPNYYETVDHINCNKNDNSVENLEWVTREENIRREQQNNLNRKNNIKANYLNWKKSSKLNPSQKLLVQNMYNNNYTQAQIAEHFQMSQSQISAIIHKRENTPNNSELFATCWYWEKLLQTLNDLRITYLETKDYNYFRIIRQILPQSYLYRSTITMNYENLLAICSKSQRRFHKLNEWSGVDDNTKPNFISWARTLPYANELIFIET